MANRKRKGRNVSGWLALDKPEGLASTRVLGEVKRLFQAAKAGHAGTLDPLASGVLPIAFGDATKTVPFIMDGRKVYRFTVRWGVETDTDDSEGSPVATSPARPERAAIEAALGAFIGEIMQTPPAFSAIKINGERAYDLARDGAPPEIEPRPVSIHRLALTEMPDADQTVFEAECGKGTYVRAIARDLGRALGTHGHVIALRRLMVGPFDETSLTTLDALRAIAEADGPAGCDALLKPLDLALEGLASVTVGGNDVGRIARGQSVLIRGARAPVSGPAYAIAAGQAIAIGEIEAGEFHPKRVFRPG